MMETRLKAYRGAMVAALYAALTLGLAPVSYGAVQVRVSEFMTLLAFYDKGLIPGLIPGLTLGCLISNVGSPFGITDMLIGTSATFLGLYFMRFCRSAFLASLMPVFSNGLLIGFELNYMADLPLLPTMGYVALGEIISVTILGNLLLPLFLKNETVRNILDLKNKKP
ncbi:QueT transporter family protein [Acidaminococcus sp. BV3L6]|uniref:QueT transporter family protein n=1 Tax=Acidaminococcus sp. (strain BV3L6) TaxID=1111120 RepID=UPI0003ADC6AD|nr:QueT transporter family protein [Acidaminococcus sp. BV3L6]ERL16830.1 QueT transporter [Acidaminococcus sp. BV3L6]